MSIQAKVTCPRCKRVWTVNQGEQEAECNCHLYCSQGTKPSDCSTSLVTFNHEASPPYGAHLGDPDEDNSKINRPVEGKGVMHRQRYCSTHGKYIYKIPIIIPVEWDSFLSRRVKPHLRALHV